MKRALVASLAFLIFAAVTLAQNSASETPRKAPPTISEKTAGMQKFPGFFTYYWDARDGKLWLQIDRWSTQFLYYETLPNGVGSNDVGLDRGQPGKTVVVHFERSGPRILLVAENERYRAVTDDPSNKQPFGKRLPNPFSGDSKLVPRTANRFSLTRLRSSSATRMKSPRNSLR